MKRFGMLGMGASLLVFGLVGCVSTDSIGPELAPLTSMDGVPSHRGTLAGSALAREAESRCRVLLSQSGAAGYESAPVRKFIIQSPVGNPGARAWREFWVFGNVESGRGFVMTFREARYGDAKFEVQPLLDGE